MGGFFGPPGTSSSSGGGGGGIGPAIAFASPPGTIDPAIAGFIAGVGNAGTGRIKVTLSNDTAWEGLPTGADTQQLIIVIVAGNFTLTLLHLNGLTTQKQILASGDFLYQLGDALELVYDSALAQWMLLV